MAAVLEMSDKTYKLIELAQREPKRSELLAIAEATEVPMWFLEGGWNGQQEMHEGVDAIGRRALRDIGGSRSARRATGD